MITSLSIKLCFNWKLSIDFSKVFNNNWRNWSWKINYIRAIGLVLGKELILWKQRRKVCYRGTFWNFKIQFDSILWRKRFRLWEWDHRREILPSGNLVLLSMIVRSTFKNFRNWACSWLIFIRNSKQELSDENVQFDIIDAIANNKETTWISGGFKSYKSDKSKLNSFKKTKRI
jgi:DNA repair protein RecN (Recombination protein N)